MLQGKREAQQAKTTWQLGGQGPYRTPSFQPQPVNLRSKVRLIRTRLKRRWFWCANVQFCGGYTCCLHELKALVASLANWIWCSDISFAEVLTAIRGFCTRSVWELPVSRQVRGCSAIVISSRLLLDL